MKKLLLIPFLFIACKAQKSTTEYKEIIKVDTLIRTQINTIYKGVTDTITIDNPCDSSGIINQFYAKLVLPNGTIQIKNKGTKLWQFQTLMMYYQAINKRSEYPLRRIISQYKKK